MKVRLLYRYLCSYTKICFLIIEIFVFSVSQRYIYGGFFYFYAAVVDSAAAIFVVPTNKEVTSCPTQPTQIVRASKLPVTKKAVGCVRESYEEGGML